MNAIFSKRPLFVAAATLTVFYSTIAWWRMSKSGPGFLGSDSYSRIAAYVLQHNAFETPFRPPLYPLFLSLWMWIFPESWEMAAVWAQGFCAVLLGVLLVSATIRLSDSRVCGFLALGLYLGNILFQFETTAKRETTLFTLVVLVFMTTCLFGMRLQSKYLVMAFSAMIAFLLRPTAIALVPVFIVCCYIDRKQQDFSLRLLLLPALVFLLPVLPWQIFVYQHTGSAPITSSSNSGQTLWKGNNPYLFSVWPQVDIDAFDPEISKAIGGADITFPKNDAQLKSQAVQFIRDNPGVFLRNAMAKACLFFSPWPIPWASGNFRLENGEPKLNNLRYRSIWILLAVTLQSLFVWCAWIGFLWRSQIDPGRRQMAYLGCTLMLCLVVIHTLTYPESRYGMALDVFLIIPAADYLFSRIKRYRWLQQP